MIQTNISFASASAPVLESTPNEQNIQLEKSSEWTTISKCEKKQKNPIVNVFTNLKISINDTSKEIIKSSDRDHSDLLTSSRAQSYVNNKSESRSAYIPKGINAILDSETKQIIREVLPNNGKNIADTKIIELISTMKNNNTLKLIDFKKRVVMIFNQAIKKDRGPGVNKIIDRWTRSKYPLIELLDSNYDSCKPITQAAWNGSIDCFRVIVTNDTTNIVLQTINSKGETLDRTLVLGKSYALSKDPSNAVFIEDRFNSCLQYFQSALITQKRHCKTSSISLEIMTEIAEISNSETDIMLKIISVYGDDIELAQKYYLATKECVSEEIFKSIEDNLADNGITFK